MITAQAAPRMLGLAAALIAAGLLVLLAAFLGNGFDFGSAALPGYCAGVLFIGVLTWWESTRERTGVLPSWTSPPALVGGWTLGWIYAPAVAAFLDDNLLDDFTLSQGGETVILAGLPLTCSALALLSLAYHATTMTFGRRSPHAERAERPVALRRVVALYLLSTAARGLRLMTLGIAFGSDLAAWGPLQSMDQWIGYVEDLRFLALALLVAHVIRRRAGYFWLVIPLLLELVIAVSSGFLIPVILPVVLCATTAAAFGRLHKRHLVLLAGAGFIVATFVPVVAAIREDQTGRIGTRLSAGVAAALATPASYWRDSVSSGDGVYDKFFGRQAEVASATGLVVTLTPSVVPFEGLERLVAIPANLIPRVIWPDKPITSRGVWFSATFRGLEEDTTSYSAMTVFSEGYLFYGWTGTLLTMLMGGAVLAVVHRRLDNPRLAPVYLALVPTILHVEPEFSSYLTTLVQRSLVFAAVFILLTHTKAGGLGRLPVRR